MEALVRVGTFLAVLTIMLLWEAFRPRRPLARPRQERWRTNLGLTLLNAASVFTHGNVALPERLDRWLRWIMVTPDMHRVQHSTRVVETNANFGFAVSWWDRLCGTYRAQPMLGQVGMDIGLSDERTPLTLGQLLLVPLRGSA